MVKKIYPFLISVPHGGTEVPDSVRPLLLLENEELGFIAIPVPGVFSDLKTM